MQANSKPEEVKEAKTERLEQLESVAASEIVDAVREFLLKNGYFRTLDKFEEETQTQGANVDAYVASSPQNVRFGQGLLLEARGMRLIFL